MARRPGRQSRSSSMFLGFLLPIALGVIVFDLLRRLPFVVNVREILLLEAIVLAIGIAVATEFLGSFHALTSWGTFLFWSATGLAAVLCGRRLSQPVPLNFADRLRGYLRDARWDGIVLIVLISFAALTLFAIALVATPNNYDSMTYHLARVGHWREYHSIAFYGTNLLRQNYLAPWAEWAMLQLVLLEGSDQLVNLVQWFSYAGCLLVVSVITELIGGSRRAGIIAAVFVATLPAAAFEATSTQNDLVMSFWLLSAIYGCVKLSLQPSRLSAFIFGASLGLGCLTKSVTLLFGAPLCLWALWALLRAKREKALPELALIAVLVLSLNAGHATRNFVTSGHLLGPQERDAVGSKYMNDTFTPGALFSNVLRNLSLHANFFHEKQAEEDAVIRMHRALGIDPNDPHTTYGGSDFVIWEGGEDGTPMPYHLIVIFLAVPILIWNRRRFTFLPFALLLDLLAAALLFCLVLKWEQFHARLHLALFIMAAPLAALALGSLLPRLITLPILAWLILASIPNILWYGPRAALGSYSVFLTPSYFQQLFRQPDLMGPYLQMEQVLAHNHVKKVGLVSNLDDWEYPLQSFGRHAVPWQVDHVLIENEYKPLETTEPMDAVLCTRPGMGPSLTIQGRVYTLAFSYVKGPDQELVIALYIPAGVPFDVPRQ